MIAWRAVPSRLSNLATVVAWYEANLGVTPVTVDSKPGEPFNLAQARNRCVEQAPARVVVLSDADVIPERRPLLAAIAAARTSNRAQLPYTLYRPLTERGTNAVANGVPITAAEYALQMRGAVSGVQVTRADIWHSHGGQDERFRGWGFEDTAWWNAHRTLLGEPIRQRGVAVSLFHESWTRDPVQYEASGALMFAYQQADGKPEQMRALIWGDTER